MYKTISVLVALAFLAAAVPTTQADLSNADKNIEWMLERRPADDMPDTVTIITEEGESVVSFDEAISLFGERTDRIDLAAMIAGAGHSAPGAINGAGDNLILEDSWDPASSCPTATPVGPGSPMFVPLDPQFWLYPGDLYDNLHSDVSTFSGGFFPPIGLHVFYTMKTAGLHTGMESSVAGNAAVLCIDWGFLGTTYISESNGVAWIG